MLKFFFGHRWKEVKVWPYWHSEEEIGTRIAFPLFAYGFQCQKCPKRKIEYQRLFGREGRQIIHDSFEEILAWERGDDAGR